ncbi:cell wall metabolism sensor histidine kinase WalK [Chamaesiphon sp. GL140_3_metabinner_50]|uniref:sensor histidine kinase n=1 Tax=Chamaesiphon sp. GL140_3_metabinner_50 TaxID=2970812 RepID=UPI0025CCD3CF|nr:PAS domain-containing sensor histidine kinase [Chamaesiphon sp. GL140_3_metabinner_50]
MFSTILLSALCGIFAGAYACYVLCESSAQKQLRQVLDTMQTAPSHEDISLPLVSQLRRRITLDRQQHQQLEQQLFSWQSLLQAAPIGYIQLDADNQVLWCNQTAQKLLQIHNWQPGQVRLLLELVRSYELDRSIATVRSSQVADELVWQFHFGYQEAADSRSIWLKANSIPLADGAIGIFIESRQDRVDAETAKERWLGDLAHEIRTPLTAIHLIAETLQSKVPPDLTRWADRILKETNRLIDLIQHFVELSQLETSSAQSLRLVEVDLVKIIDDVWHTIEPISKQQEVELVYQGSPQVILKLDVARFTQVLINLFDNSLKYCPDRGHIWIDVKILKSDRSSVEIDLYDDGSGFTAADIPYVFDRLYRGDVSRQREPTKTDTLDARTTGSGLGLSIVRQIILAHQGSIVANNHPQTGGAWFKIILPIN